MSTYAQDQQAALSGTSPRPVAPVDIAASASVGPSSAQTNTLITYNVPPSCQFFLTAWANSVGQVAALGFATWRFRINGANKFPLDNVRDTLGDPTQPWPVGGDALVAFGGDQLTVFVENSDTTADYDLGARIVGRLVAI